MRFLRSAATLALTLTSAVTALPQGTAAVIPGAPAAPATAAVDGRIYFLDMMGARVLSTATDGTDLKVIASGLRQGIDGIAVDKEAGYIYVSNMGSTMGLSASGSIMRMGLDGKNVQTIVAVGKTHTPKQLILVREAAGKKLYWGDREGMKVMRANVDGTGLETLVDVSKMPCASGTAATCKHIVGVAVDTVNGFAYWTQKGPDAGGQGSIHRVPLAASPNPAARTDIQTLFTKLPCPIDLHWVGETNSLYWTDRAPVKGGNSVNRVTMAPGPSMMANPKVEMMFEGLSTGIGIAVDVKGKRLWATDFGGKVSTSDLEGKNMKVIAKGLGSLTGIDYAA